MESVLSNPGKLKPAYQMCKYQLESVDNVCNLMHDELCVIHHDICTHGFESTAYDVCLLLCNL